MANQALKKRAFREKKVGRYYTSAFLLSLTVWTVNVARRFKQGTLNYGKLGFFWRAALVLAGFSTSLFGVLSNLRLGLPFSLSNDLFFVTAAATLGSVFCEFAYALFLLVPLYALFKAARALFRWATAPPPQTSDESLPKKQRVKYRTFRS